MEFVLELEPPELSFEADELEEILGDDGNLDHVNDETLKNFVWKQHKKEIVHALKSTRKRRNAKSTSTATTSIISTPSSSFAEGRAKELSVGQLGRRLELLDTISNVQRVFLDTESIREAFGILLTGLLHLFDSEYGFIGEVKYTEDGEKYLRIHSRVSTVLPVDESTQAFFQHGAEAVNLYNLHSLFGVCITEKCPVLSNDVASDPRAGGVPPGHPNLDKFLGVPFFKQHGEILGVIGIANKEDGYTEEDVELAGPFVLACSSVIQAHRQIKKNTSLITDLEQKVRLRTENLERVNQDLAEANKRVLQASAAQLEHFACMSHEIRTPLNAVLGLGSLLQESELNPMQTEAVQMIVSSGDLLLTVVNDVLDYSKLETGNVEIEIRHSSLQEALNALVHSFATKAQQKQIRLRTIFDATVPEFLNTDSRRLQQILYNLLGNALKFSNQGSFVDLHVGVSNGEVPASAFCPSLPLCRENGQFVRFTVKDYGSGIAESDFSRIFEPFRQATYETEQIYGGTGLGLTITSKLVHGLGGHVFVESSEGEFSKFTVDLPIDEPITDQSKMTENLNNSILFFICNDDTVVSQLGQTLADCNVQWVGFKSSDELEEQICCKGFLEAGRTYISLVDEDLFSETTHEKLSQMVEKSILLTFGPRFRVPQSQFHYRSIVQVIPSVLMKSMGSYAVASTNDRSVTKRRSFAFRMENAHYHDYSILIAEDNKINQKVLIQMLKRIGIEKVDVVENGQQAVDAEASKPYDVVLMDMQMPVMNGLQACEIITDRSTGHRIASVVFATAHVSLGFEAQCTKSGASGFLPKPFNISDIEQCLKSISLLRADEEPNFTSVNSSIHLDAETISETSSLGTGQS